MGARFLVPLSAMLERVDGHMVLLELSATIIQPIKPAAFLVAYAGHALRVHVQQMSEVTP